MKKPTLKRFKELSEKHGGNQTKIAEEIGVSRITVRFWCKNDEEFDNVIKNQRAKAFDDIYKSAVHLASGIPLYRNGKFAGWKERPDPTISKYLLGVLGREEGFIETTATKIEEHKTTQIDVSGLSNEELATLNEILKKTQTKN
ncbi:MAG: hypothetical protein IKJ52_06930 [Muribaculaceae bacterium]|nr:hypothetical protein [Muribaculaceae bacterium]